MVNRVARFAIPVMAVLIVALPVVKPWDGLASAARNVKGSGSGSTSSGLTVRMPNRDSKAVDLQGAALAGRVWVEAVAEKQTLSVVFFLDPEPGSSHHNTDTTKPFELADGVGFDTATLVDGPHSLKAVHKLKNGTTKAVTADFTVKNATATTTTSSTTTSTTTTSTTSTTTSTTIAAIDNPDTPWVRTMFVSNASLAEWRRRAVSGPYRVAGDASTNSPGDWERIVADKNDFMANPAATRWSGPAGWRNITATGCIGDADAGGEAEWMTLPATLNSAAFYALVKADHTVAQAVAAELKAQVNYGDTKFADRLRYCLLVGPRSDNVIVTFMGDWLSTELVAFDFLRAYEADTGKALFSPSEAGAFVDWAAAFGAWVHHHVQLDLSQLFVDRLLGNYTLTSAALSTPAHAQKLYDGGPVPWKVSIKYNNRNARGVRAAGLAAVLAGDSSMIAENKRYWKELITYGVFADGALSDFERWTSTEPTKGWKYATEMLSPMATVAAALAGTGDTELYTFATTAGSDQTKVPSGGAPKSLGRAVHDLFRFVAKTDARTVDGKAIRPSTIWVHELGMTSANAHYLDTTVRATYLRTNTDPYPSSPSRGKFDPWRADCGIFPGGLLLFGQMEGVA